MACAGVYIHIPFCSSRCSYCDFSTWTYKSGIAERYVKTLTKEISGFSKAIPGSAIDTIYFGGGTPSTLSFSQIARILEAIKSQFEVQAGAEITLEIDPATTTLDELRELRRCGINRASFGAQTFNDRELRKLGRAHDAKETLKTYVDLRAVGFSNVNMDLIAGLPGQTLDGWLANLNRAIEMEPEHLSIYLLELHEGTPLADRINAGSLPRPSDETAAEMYRAAADHLSRAGYEHYEISNFCKSGFESRHNNKYWTGAPVYGFGCSAHSYDGARMRWSNKRNTISYIELLEAGDSPVVESNQLDENAVQAEAVFLGMRLLRGLDLSEHKKRFGVDLTRKYQEDLERLSEAGLIEVTEDVIKLTRAGALLSNEVFTAFV